VVAQDVIVIARRAGCVGRVKLAVDGVDNTLDLGQLLFEVFSAGVRAILVNPVRGVLDRVKYCLLVLVAEFTTETILVAELSLETINE